MGVCFGTLLFFTKILKLVNKLQKYLHNSFIYSIFAADFQ